MGIAVVVQTFEHHMPEVLSGIAWIKPTLDAIEVPVGLLVVGELLRLAFFGAHTFIMKIRIWFKQIKIQVTVEVPMSDTAAKADGPSASRQFSSSES